MPTDPRQRPIPLRKHPPTALEHSGVPIETSDPRADEPLVDLADYSIAAHDYYSRTDGLNAPYYRGFPSASVQVRCRKSVAARLAHVNEALAAYGVELFVLNGYRSLDVQSDLWAFFIERAAETLKSPTEANCIAFAGEYCSDPRAFDPSDSRTWPTHITGGALDTTLRAKETGELLFMGGMFDDPSALSHTQHYEMELRHTSANNHPMPLSYDEALRNRRLLYWTMIEEGFANYPYEWWHFDWGTQMWVINAALDLHGAKQPGYAWYGPAS